MLLVQILLVHKGSELLVVLMDELHRLIVHVLLHQRVMTRIIDVVRVMMMNLGITRGG